jgi:aspartate-semialdehyde dehydrogenase
MSTKIPVSILGATGTVGQKFVRLLADHPWFEISAVAASEQSVGQRYGEVVRWREPVPIPAAVAAMTVSPCEPPLSGRIVFSAMDASVAGPIEQRFAAAGAMVVTNTRNHRMEADVPLLIPEVNADHLALLKKQDARGWKGRIVTNPNCVVVVYAMALAPLRQFGLKTSMLTSLQAISGAGYPGVPSWDILGNVIPFIGGGEEEKIETETNKILGAINGGSIENHPVTVSAAVTRVPVQNGHTASIAVALEQQPDAGAIIAAWNGFRGKPQEHDLPSAPKQPIVYLTDNNRPQPALDANRDGGMTVTVGRLRRCPVLDYKFVALGHNTIRGAAGAAILNAELMHREGLLS